jgi:ATP-dependent DNA helicase RecG
VLTPDQLRTRVRNLEADNVEVTRSTRDTDKFGEAICAFANDLPNRRDVGILVIGINDDGSCAGIDVTDELLKNLSSIRSDGNLHPFPTMSVRKDEIDKCPVAVVEVEPSDNPPVRYRGRAWVRVGPTKRLATGEDERRLTEKRRWGNLPFDQHPVRGATVEDLDLSRFHEEYLPSAVPVDVLEQNRRTQTEQMAALRLLNQDGVPTVLAILLLGKDARRWFPGAYVQFVRFDGDNITDPVKDQKEIAGPLSVSLRQLDEILVVHISTAADSSGGREIRHPDYPILALQEFIRNAVIHRNYEGTNAPIKIYWYANRIEIISPGGPFGQVSPETFGKPNVVDYRNPGIAEAVKNLGFAQRFGLGIPRAQAELARNGNPPAEFQVEPNSVLVTVRKRQ